MYKIKSAKTLNHTHNKHMKKPVKFKIITPKNYKRKPLAYFTEWLQALESGRFRQTTGVLAEYLSSKKLGYCCLGVLCRVQGTLNKQGNQWNDGYHKHSAIGSLSSDNPSFKDLGETGAFPPGVEVHVYDVDSNEILHHCSNLIDCNDDGELNFKEIAKVIRRIWKKGPKPKTKKK